MREKNDFLIFGFCLFSAPVGGFRGSGAGKSGPPWSALHFGVGGRYSGGCGVIWARKCK